MTYSEYYKANNFLSVAKKADNYFLKNNQNRKGSYDFDWFLSFYEAVGNISDEISQELWAKILAGEIAEPGSISLKTIESLKNMRKSDAELFSKISSYSFLIDSDRMFLPNNKCYLENKGIRYVDIMKLSEHGLVFNDSTIGVNIEISANPQIICTNNDLLMTVASTDGNKRTAKFMQYPFTTVGKELAFMTGNIASYEDFIEYGKCLAELKYKVSVHKVIKKEGDSFIYDDDDLLMKRDDEL